MKKLIENIEFPDWLIIALITFLLLSLFSSCKDETQCLGIQQKVEQIRKLGGDNTQWIQQKIIELQLQNPECL